ncbi:MAG: hypothetical protein ABR577_14255 [Pyrinomonadaceae bacterium]
MPYHLGKSNSLLWITAVFVLLLGTQFLIQGQTVTDVLPPPCNDSSYENCPKLAAGHDCPYKLGGPLVYSFASDDALRSVLGSQQAVDDFKSRARNAAQGWANRSGVQLSEAQPGQVGNISISASSDPNIRQAIGQVGLDPNDANRRTLTISDDYNSFSGEGRDWLFGHEFGHIIGIDDVLPDECPNVNTIMRQTYTGQQLINGVGGGQPGLPGPASPSDCDLSKARAEQQAYIAGNSGGGGGDGGGGGGGGGAGGGGGDYCTTYWWVTYECSDGGGCIEKDRQYAGCW